ncbi:MAG: UPF0721 transmembrane protein [Gammaproteobacteria bacterium]|nr:MAG: UPF0721 transmembrane protein [Gammaproteobacteria bacterium]
MYDTLLYALAGGAVGFVVGMTGVGGGSFMTPILLAFGFPPPVAVGTDLLYAAITKSGGVVSHALRRTVEWPVVLYLSAGSLPAALATTLLLHQFKQRGVHYDGLITTCLGVMLVATAAVLVFRSFLMHAREEIADERSPLGAFERRHARLLTWLLGLLLGVAVTLTSVGAGAVAAAVLALLYPRMSMLRVIGTDLAHAVPLTLIGGIAHWTLGHVDFALLGGLLIGSLPGIWLGTRVASAIPERFMQRGMATLLFLLGLRYTLMA